MCDSKFIVVTNHKRCTVWDINDNPIEVETFTAVSNHRRGVDFRMASLLAYSADKVVMPLPRYRQLSELGVGIRGLYGVQVVVDQDGNFYRH